MEVDIWSLLLGLVFGSIGVGYCIYGKKKSNAVVRYVGVALMIFPYFIDNNLAVLVTGLVLMAVPKFVRS